MGLIKVTDVYPREGIWENCFVSDAAQWSQPQYRNLSFLKHPLECKIDLAPETLLGATEVFVLKCPPIALMATGRGVDANSRHNSVPESLLSSCP